MSAGPGAGGGDGIPGDSGHGAYLRAHHDPLSDTGLSDADGADLCREAGRGGGHHHAAYPGQEIRIFPGEDLLRAAAGGGRQDMRI